MLQLIILNEILGQCPKNAATTVLILYCTRKDIFAHDWVMLPAHTQPACMWNVDGMRTVQAAKSYYSLQ